MERGQTDLSYLLKYGWTIMAIMVYGVCIWQFELYLLPLYEPYSQERIHTVIQILFFSGIAIILAMRTVTIKWGKTPQ
jgi:hypothetical protein